MQKVLEFDDGSEQYRVKEFKENTLESYWEKWIIFKPNRSKDWQTELKKHLPPYFESNVNKINEFSMRENGSPPPCPQEFLEHLLNGIILRNELGLYRAKYYYYRELQQLLIEYLKMFYFRMDAIIDIFQTNTKLSVSKEKYPKIVVKCSNCSFYVFITVYCPNCMSEFYCDETCQKIHNETHKKNCVPCVNKLPKIIDPLRIEVHINSQTLGEEIDIYNEHNMKFSKMMKGQILLSFLYKSLRKDRWFKTNSYLIEDKVEQNYITIKREPNPKPENLNSEGKDYICKMDSSQIDKYAEDEFRAMLKLSVLQEMKLSFYKLGALLNDILIEQHPNLYKFILIFSFP